MTFLSTASQPNDAAALRELFIAIRDETASVDQFREFEERLLQDVQAIDYYARFMQLHVLLEEKLASPRSHRDLMFPPVCDVPITQPAIIGSPPLNLLSTAYHGTVGFFSQEVPFAILVATLIFVLGGIIGSVMTVEHYTQLPGQSRSYASGVFATGTDQEPTAPARIFVGRITGMVDCKRADNRLASAYYLVALGEKYMLASGLMEITYDTGAKVILQGPCVYEVESATGGFLSLGKLTARVEKKGERGEGRGESESTGKASGTLATSHQPLTTNSNPQPPIPNPSSSPSPLSPLPSPLFAVRTPTVVVTDLGTEFGVEVDDRRHTQMIVFQGEVELSGAAGVSLGRFRAGESASVDRNGDVQKGQPPANAFVRAEGFTEARTDAVRRRREATLEQFRKDPALVAYYTFDNEREAPDRLLNRAAATAGRMDGILGEADKPDTRPTWTDGRGPGRRALRFESDKNQAVRVPHDDALNVGPSLTLMAWVKYRVPMPPRGCVLLARREPSPVATSFQFAVVGPESETNPFSIQFHTGIGSIDYSGSVLPEKEQWLQVAATLAPGTKQFFVNGSMTDYAADASTPAKLKTDLWIGATSPVLAELFEIKSRFGFDGLIDEIWIFGRALSVSEIHTLYALEAIHESNEGSQP